MANTAGPPDASTARTVASLLKMYFRESPAPLFPSAVYHDLLKNRKVARGLEDIIRRRVPQGNRDNLAVLMQLLYRVTQLKAVNKMSANALSICWAQSLLRTPPASATMDEHEIMFAAAMDSTKCSQVVETVISNFTDIFELEPPSQRL